MSVTLLYADRPPYRADAAATAGDDLWLAADALPAATGWTLTADGLCQGDRCVPIPPGARPTLLRGGDPATVPEVNVAALARLLEQPVLRDDTHAVWCIGDSAPARRAALHSLEAPDFALPDLEGRPHALSEYRGRKVFLVSWASW
jgi:hypothetical protein